MNRLPRPPKRRRIGLWLAVSLGTVACLTWARLFLGCVLVVGDSMRPTLDSGDLLLVDKLAYANTAPRRGDMVVARFRSEYIVKRVIALPGEAVEVDNGGVRINGEPWVEEHPIQPGTLHVGRGELLQERYAVLGDNRCETEGLLFFAVIPREHLVGKVVRAFHWPRVLRLGVARNSAS